MFTRRDILIPTALSLALVGILYVTVSLGSDNVYKFPQAATGTQPSCFKWVFNNKSHGEVITSLGSPAVGSLSGASVDVDYQNNLSDYPDNPYDVVNVKVINPQINDNTPDLKVADGKVLILDGGTHGGIYDNGYIRDAHFGGDFIFRFNGANVTQVKFTTIDMGDEFDGKGRINNNYYVVTTEDGDNDKVNMNTQDGSNLPESYIWDHSTMDYGKNISKIRIHFSGSAALDNFEYCNKPAPTATPVPTNTPTPVPSNTPTPVPSNTPTPDVTSTPTPSVSCVWEEYSNKKWSATNPNGWLDQWRQHTSYSSYTAKNTPKLMKTFTINQKKDVKVALQQVQVNDNEGGSCNPQFNEEAWVGVYKLDANGQVIMTVGSHLFTDGNYDLSGDQKQSYTITLNQLPAGTYGISSVWAGDGRNGPDFNSSNNRSYTDPENVSRRYDYGTNPPQLVSNAYSTAACRWNGSYGIRTKVCL